jgi:hypothetical protein
MQAHTGQAEARAHNALVEPPAHTALGEAGPAGAVRGWAR